MWFHRWIYEDLWIPIWPNIAATVIMSTWVVRRVHKKLKDHHAKIAEVIDKKLGINGPSDPGS